MTLQEEVRRERLRFAGDEEEGIGGRKPGRDGSSQLGGDVPVVRSRRGHRGAGPGARSIDENVSSQALLVINYDPSSGDSDAIVAVQAQGGSSAADLEKVTAKTFLDIQIDGKPAGFSVHAWHGYHFT